MKRTRWCDAAAIALIVAVLVGLGFVSRPHPPGTTRPSALIIGESYTWGTGLAEMSYGCNAAAKLGWLCHLSRGPGTGYVSGGPANRLALKDMGPPTSSGEHLPGLAAMYKPDIVILDGLHPNQWGAQALSLALRDSLPEHGFASTT